MIPYSNILPLNRASAYRFKRWTGKSWAVFSSLKRHIEVGFLSVAISSGLAVKSRCFTDVERNTTQDRSSSDKDQTFNVDDPGMIMLSVLLFILGGSMAINDTDSCCNKGLTKQLPYKPPIFPTCISTLLPFYFQVLNSLLNDRNVLPYRLRVCQYKTTEPLMLRYR